MAHQLIGFYTIADGTDGILKVLRSYQYFAASKISARVSQIAKDGFDNQDTLGGYIWHTTGSGKTMTSFKSAQLIANSKDADKVIFLMDRIELGTQSLKEYRAFSDDDEEFYQVEKSKIAIATGGPFGLGPGKSVQKNFLPQSSSDFIYAIIVEEYGLLGALLIVFIYFLLLFRVFIVIRKTTTIFGILLVIGVGCPIVFQATINMAVATNLFPVTGQTLPLISSGGTSIWMTCFALGMILSVSSSTEETEEDILDDNPLDILHETI